MISIFLLIALLLVVGIVYLVKVLIVDKIMNSSSNDSYVENNIDYDAEDRDDEDTDRDDDSVTTEVAVSDDLEGMDIDYNLAKNRNINLEGVIKSTVSGDRIVKWDEPLNFYDVLDDGQKQLLEGATSAYIEDDNLMDGIFDAIGFEETVIVQGDVYFEEGRLYIEADIITDTTGNDFADKVEEQKEEEEDYIFPHSATRALTEEEIRELTPQQMCYARNEIYARHGRKFDSKELQDYFNSKSWYSGTISPDRFKPSTMLSDLENKNAALILKIEKEVCPPSGYVLDK